jgi:hypothetical protein
MRVESSYERTVRVQAPVNGLYREVDSIHRLARFIAQIDSHLPGANDDYGMCRASFFFGPLAYQVDGDIAVERVLPPHCLAVALRVPTLRLELDGTFDLSISAQYETTLRYAATIRSSHPVLRRMHNALTGALVEHVDTTTDLITVRAGQYARAERRFTELEHT